YTKEIILDGTYQGEDLKLLNPIQETSQCIQELYLNGRLIEFDFESNNIPIDLSAFSMGEYIEIRIVYDSDCHPRAANPKSILSDTRFDVISIDVNEASIKWTTQNERNQQPYIIEQMRFNQWIPIGKVVANGSDGYNNYTFPVKHHSSLNKYRVKRKHISNIWSFSSIVRYKTEKEEITFYPTRVESTIYLSSETAYRIFSENGMIVKVGEGKEIDVSAFNTGIFYLQIDNKTEKFFKK
ncbi:MAG: hypothetical protein IH946_11570, partial [Bacteroidetes bacterium]|nr:hypothetical protein [Bacteroidota bacterium]